jgi:hypothetical protein
MTKSIALVVLLVGCQVAQQDGDGNDTDNVAQTEQAVGGGGTSTVKVVNTSAEPVPVAISNLPAVSTGFKTVLVYNQQTGQFPDFVVPANQRIIVRDVHSISLVPQGASPYGAIWVPPVSVGNGAYQGAFEAALDYKLMSNFQNTQDRYGASSSVYMVLEPGQHLTWYVTNRAGENAFTPVNYITASLSISGDVVAAN